MILLIDNYDSFTYNLQRYLKQWGQVVEVVRNDDDLLLQDLKTRYSAIIISPGPCGPAEAGYCLQIVKAWSGRLPILGVCLGHQVLCAAFGAMIARALQPMHGRSSPLQLQACRLFAGIPNGSEFARYHSLVATAETLPDELRVIAWSPQGEVMAVQHRTHASFGVQFHPESVLSPHGYRLLGNFLDLAGLPKAPCTPAADLADESQLRPPLLVESLADQPVVLPNTQRLPPQDSGV